MVEYTSELDSIFASLADPTRRDMLERVAYAEYSVGELVQHYQVSFAAISKHLKVLERSKLIIKRREGKKQIISIAPYALHSVDEYLRSYRQMWQGLVDRPDALLAD